MEEKTKFGWKKYLLIASLGLNLLVAFAVGGAFFKTNKPGPSTNSVFLQGAMMRALPQDERESLHRNFRERREGKKQENGSLGSLRQELKDVIVAVPFEAEALSVVLEKQRTLRDSYGKGGDAALVQVISQMSDAERAVFAKNIKFRKEKRKDK